jgi:hypothetical protein
MSDRDFNEIDLRKMLADAEKLRPDIERGRWGVETRHEGRRWEVIVEPDERLKLLVVITAYPVETNT